MSLKYRKQIMLSLPIDLIPKVQAKAKAENRKVTNYIETLILKDLGKTVDKQKTK